MDIIRTSSDRPARLRFRNGTHRTVQTLSRINPELYQDANLVTGELITMLNAIRGAHIEPTQAIQDGFLIITDELKEDR